MADATDLEFKQVKAYSSIKDTVANICKNAPKFPNSNFTDVVPVELLKETFHSLILSNALQIQPTLKKVIVLKLIPRYDPPCIDPLGLKSDLSKMFNEKLEELCMSSPFKSKVFIGSHTIDCTGAIRESRYCFAQCSNRHSLFIEGIGKLNLENLMGSTCMGLLEERHIL